MQKKYILGSMIVNILLVVLLGVSFFQKGTPEISKVPDWWFTSSIQTNLPAVVALFANQDSYYAVENGGNIQDQVIQWPKGTRVWWSAFFVDANGYLLTSKHVIQDWSAYFAVFQDWSTGKIDKIWNHPSLDLAILHIQKNNQTTFPTVTLANDQLPAIGEPIVIIGTPFSQYINSISQWILSAQNRTLSLDKWLSYTGLYQLDINTNPGNSGWPVINTDGKVFAIVTAMATQSSHIWFAIPLSQKSVLTMLSDIKSQDKIISSE